MFDFQLIKESFPFLLRGALVTIQIALCSGFIGTCLGTLLALAENSKSKILQWLVTIYITVIRGTPMLIQITFAYYVLPQFGLQMPAFWTAVVAIGMNSGAYVSQIIKSGIASVGRGQIEAARVLGLSQWQITRYIILPQAFQVVIPSLGNEFITLIKDSSLASFIGVVELTKEGLYIRGRTLDALSTFAAVAFIYFILTTTLSIFINRLEHRMNRHVKH